MQTVAEVMKIIVSANIGSYLIREVTKSQRIDTI